ncbi:MAG: SRPBCC family protein [Paludibacteraceae bacterium]
MTIYESEIKTISKPQEVVFNILSDLSNLGNFKNVNIEGQDKVGEYLKDIEFDKDSLRFSVPAVGHIGFRIIEREPYKTIKLEAENSPIAANGWIQLAAASENTCKMRITIKAELPMMVKMMVDSKLKKGVNTLADGLAQALNAPLPAEGGALE